VSIPTYQLTVPDPNPAPNGSDVLEKALADLNGDGKLDLIVGEGEINGTPGGLYWYQNPGSPGGTWTRHTITPQGNFYERMGIIDLNGDGHPDIIASGGNTISGGTELVWFQNPGDLASNPNDAWTMHVIDSSAGAHSIALADLLGNGKTDVVASATVGLGYTGYIEFQGNTPDQWTLVKYGNPGDAVAMYDDGSGYGAINIVGVDQNNGDLVYWQNPREFGGNPLDGSQWREHIIQTAVPAGIGASIATGYLTSSGRMDIVVAQNEGEGSFQDGLWWYQNLGGGNFQQHLLDGSYQAVHQINIADMNNDGTQDIVVGEQEQADMGPNLTGPPGGRLAVFYNDGNGNFTPQVISNMGIQNQVVGDVFGTGWLDIFGANHGVYGGNKELQLWLNNGTSGGGGGTNLIQDPGFENQTNNTTLQPPWFIQDPSGEQINMENLNTAHSGGQEANFYQPNNTGNTGFSDIYQTVTVAANTNYTLSGWFDDSDNSGFTGGEFGVRTPGGSVVAQTAIPPTGGVSAMGYYSQLSFTFNSGNNTTLQVFAGYTPSQNSWLHVDDLSLTSNGTTVQPPAAPTGLSATTGNGQVALTWTASSGAASYNIYRGTGSGQESKIASGVSGSSFTDTSFSNGTTYYYEVTAVNTGGESGRSNEAIAKPQSAVVGTGTGLTGQYYSDTNLQNFVVTRTDSTVNFTWPNDTAPVSGLPADNWSVKWTGQVQAQFSEAYTFTTVSDDGVRLYINGTLVINDWTYHAATNDNSAPIQLTAGQKYTIEMDYFEGGGAATAQLYWSSPSTPKAIIPTSQLYAAATGGNLVQNSGFETGSLSPWFQEGNASSGVDTNSEHAHSGTASAALWGVNGSADLAQNVAVTPNTNYTLSAWIDASGTSNGALGVKTTGGTVLASTPLTNTDPGPFTHQADFRFYTVSFNSGNNTTLKLFAGYQGNGGGFINLDDVSLTASSSTNLVQNATYETGSLSPFVVEGNPTAAGIDNNPGHSHSGTDNAYIFDNSGSSKFVDIAQTISVMPNTTYTLSVWVDANVSASNVIAGVKTTGGTVLATTTPYTGNDPGSQTSGGSFYKQLTLTFNSGNNNSVVIFAGYQTPGTGANSWINMDDWMLM
jgi:hypothetical protein